MTKIILMALGLALLAPMVRADDESDLRDQLDAIQAQLDEIERDRDQAEWDRFQNHLKCEEPTGWARGWWKSTHKHGKGH
jgi:hypothetical protein